MPIKGRVEITGKDRVVADSILAHSIDLSALDANTRGKVFRQIRRMEKELRAKLSSGDLTEFGQKSINRLLSDAEAIIKKNFGKLPRFVDGQGIAENTAKATADAMGSVLVDIAVSTPTAAVIAATAGSALIEGAPIAEWWAKQSADTIFRFSGAVRQGIYQAETNTVIIRRVTDQLRIAQNNAAALVQTSVNTIANDARLATFKANQDVMSGLTWLATLDARVCPECAARDGYSWDMDTKPIGGHGIPFENPPIHFNDRCVLVPMTKTFKELGLDVAEPGPGPRATADGPINGTFDDFLERKGQEFQDSVFGSGRADMYRRGIITRAQLIGQNGNLLTLEQLQKKYR